MKNRLREKFTQVDNKCLNHKEISLKAKGLYSFLCSKPEDWEFSYRGLVSQLKEGEKAIREAVRELVKAEFLVRVRAIKKVNEESSYAGYDWIINPTKEDLLNSSEPMGVVAKIGTTQKGDDQKGDDRNGYDISNTKRSNTKRSNTKIKNDDIFFKLRSEYEKITNTTVTKSISNWAEIDFYQLKENEQKKLLSNLKEYYSQNIDKKYLATTLQSYINKGLNFKNPTEQKVISSSNGVGFR